MQQAGNLIEQGRDPAGVVEVFHQESAGGLQVQDKGSRPRQLVEQGQRQVDADPSRDGGQVHDGVGGAAHRVDGPDRVLKGVLSEYL